MAAEKGPFIDCADAQCLSLALTECRQAHLAESFWTIEGTPVFVDYFVRRSEGKCTVVVFHDASRDYWGGCKILRATCPSITAAQSNDSEAMGCSSNEVLYQAEVCPDPTAARPAKPQQGPLQ
jgi:hypothetical protein